MSKTSTLPTTRCARPTCPPPSSRSRSGPERKKASSWRAIARRSRSRSPTAGAAPSGRSVRLERAGLHPLGERRFDARGDLVASFAYGAWDGGFPRRIVVGRPNEGYEAEFTLEKAEVNAAVPDRAFVPRVPADYSVVEVGS